LQRDSENHNQIESLLTVLRAARFFEILGLNKVFHLNISHILSRIEGIGLIEVEIEKKLFQTLKSPAFTFRNWWNIPMEENRRKHMFNPTTISKLQQAVRLNSPESYKEYSTMVNDQSKT
jgi:glutamate synthase (ferredoxin)